MMPFAHTSLDPHTPASRLPHLPPPWGSGARQIAIVARGMPLPTHETEEEEQEGSGGRGRVGAALAAEGTEELVCPVCGHLARAQKCKVVCPNCRSIVMNCSEF